MRSLRLPIILIAAIAGFGTAARADEACTPMKWDVTHERALFSGSPRAIAAGQDTGAAPALLPDALYEVALEPQDKVTLAVPPGGRARTQGVFAGLARLQITAAGTYRIALAAPGWIDVLGEHGALAAGEHAGGGCDAPHKIVQFDLPPGEFVLQLSSVGASRIRLTVTRAP